LEQGVNSISCGYVFGSLFMGIIVYNYWWTVQMLPLFFVNLRSSNSSQIRCNNLVRRFIINNAGRQTAHKKH
jgi:hypothetical protein